MGRSRVVIEVAAGDAACARDLAAGGIFVRTCTLALTEECDLVVRTAAGELTLVARAVFADPAGGVGLELVGFSSEMKAQLAALLAPPAPPEPELEPEPEPPNVPAEEELLTLADEAPEDVADPTDRITLPEEEAVAGAEPRATDGTTREPLAKNIYERLRGLTLAQQVKAANSADPGARMALERMYGKNVWEPLLRNPRLTAPEVARIARMGALPRPLVEVIVSNGAWLQMGEVRRALLTNPRLGTDQILRILRMLPKHELKVASSTTAYTYAVRDAAKRLIKEQGG